MRDADVIDDLDFEATCSPDFHLPEMQNIAVRLLAGDQRVASLHAVRYALAGFSPDRMRQVVRAFDEHTAFAHGLAVEMQRRSRILAKRYEDAFTIGSGFIGVLKIRTAPEYRGHRLGVSLLRHLRSLHAGMVWYAGLQAAPQEIEPDAQGYASLRRRLVAYYASDETLGFREDAPRASPGLMTTLWDQE